MQNSQIQQIKQNSSPIEFAQTMLGMGEVPNRSQIQEYLRNGGENLDPATTAWCAAFMNSSLGHAGIEGTGSNMARSFLNWGDAVDDPREGDIAVFSRGDPNGPYGHVGFFAGRNPDGSIRVLGGNQGNSVSYANYGADRLLGFRRAPGEGGSISGLPMPEQQPEMQMAGLSGLMPPQEQMQPRTPQQYGFSVPENPANAWQGLQSASGNIASALLNFYRPGAA